MVNRVNLTLEKSRHHGLWLENVYLCCSYVTCDVYVYSVFFVYEGLYKNILQIMAIYTKSSCWKHHKVIMNSTCEIFNVILLKFIYNFVTILYTIYIQILSYISKKFSNCFLYIFIFISDEPFQRAPLGQGFGSLHKGNLHRIEYRLGLRRPWG